MGFSRFFESPTPEEMSGKSWEYWLFRGIPHAMLDSMRAYTRLETEGIENIPRTGSVMVAPNHSGVLGWDAFIVQNEILKRAKRIPRTMSHNFWHKNDVLSYMSNRMGFVPQDFKKAIKILRRNNLMLIFPEAEAGNFKPSTQMYQLQEFNPGFVSLALMSGACIIPTCVIGAEEAHLNLGTLDWTEKFIGARIPLPLNLFPLPVKWKLIFLKPIKLKHFTRKETRSMQFLEEVAQLIRMQIQQRINKELIKRGVFKYILDG